MKNIKCFTLRTVSAACAALLMLMSGALFVSADAVQQTADTEQPVSSGEDLPGMVIHEPGTYTLTGSMKGTVYVDPGEGDVTLILDNADIEGVSAPAIMAVSGDHLTIELTECSYNRVADTENNTEEAAIVSRVDTVFRGCGCLQAEGISRYGIRTENADLTFACGKYLLLSKDSGILMDGQNAGTLYLTGGCVFVNAGKEPPAAADSVVKTAGMLEKTAKTDVRRIDCCREGDCQGCCCDKKCRRTATVDDDDDDDDDEECDCRESSADHPGPLVKGIVSNAAVSLEEDEKPVTIVFEEGSRQVQVSESGTYHISGHCGNGSITVMKNTAGVVLILDDLDLTNLSGAALKIGSSAVVKVIIRGRVSLADAEQADDSEKTDSAVIKGDADSEICIAGDGTLTVNGRSGDGIAMEENSSLVIDGNMEINIKAAADGITTGQDAAVLNGRLTIEAGDQGIHADHIVTVGEENGDGPEIQITESYEGIEAAVVNIESGTVNINASADGIDTETAGDKKDASVNLTGGSVQIHSGENGIDSDGNINLISGKAVIDSKGEDGSCNCTDAEGDLYIADTFTLDCGCSSESEESTEE